MDIFGEHPSIPIGVAILIAIYLGACRVTGRRPTRRQAMWFAIAMGAILFTHTELDELADARIFSMHMLQHLMQTFVIPPLILLGTPGWMMRPWILSRPIKPVARLLTTPVVAFLIFSAVFVTAHFPPIFDQMCRDENFHIFLHLLFMAAGMLLWWPILSPLPELPRLSYPAQILYLFLLMIPMTAVAAPITLATRVIYPWYTEGAHGWGLKPLEDQVLGGLIMWIGQGTYLMFVFTFIFYRWQQREDSDIPVLPASTTPDLRVVRSRRVAHSVRVDYKCYGWSTADLVTVIHAAYVAVCGSRIRGHSGWLGSRMALGPELLFSACPRRDDPVRVLRGAHWRNLSTHHPGRICCE